MKIDKILLGFLILLLNTRSAYAHGDMVVAGAVTLSVVLQIAVVIWIFISKKIQIIRAPSIIMMLFVFMLIWVSLDMPNSGSKSDIVLLWLAIIIPLVFLFSIRRIASKVTPTSKEQQPIKADDSENLT